MKYAVNDINYQVNTGAVAVYVTTLTAFLISLYYVVIWLVDLDKYLLHDTYHVVLIFGAYKESMNLEEIVHYVLERGKQHNRKYLKADVKKCVDYLIEKGYIEQTNKNVYRWLLWYHYQQEYITWLKQNLV